MIPAGTRRSGLGGWCAVAALTVVVACERTDAPEDPVWGKQACAHCAMVVGDPRFAAQAVAKGERKYFDDVGCFVLWAEERGAGVERSWVRDARTGVWKAARSSTYVHGARTPMDFGYEARGSGDDATRAVSWDEMRSAVLTRVASERTSERSE